MQKKVTQAVADVSELKTLLLLLQKKLQKLLLKLKEVKDALDNTDGRVTTVEGTLKLLKQS